MAVQLRRYHRIAVLVAGLICLIALSSAAGASKSPSVAAPAAAIPAGGVGNSIFAGIGRPGNDQDSFYTSVDIKAPLRNNVGRSVARMSVSNPRVSAADVRFFPQVALKPDVVGFRSLASVRYHLDGHQVYVITSEPTPATQSLQIILGEKQVALNSNRMAYVSRDWERKKEDKSYRKEWTRVSYAQDGLIVTIYSDLAEDELVGFAKGVVLDK